MLFGTENNFSSRSVAPTAFRTNKPTFLDNGVKNGYNYSARYVDKRAVM